ncbi:808_t:CDS:2, partial [Funneliformis mosseae]
SLSDSDDELEFELPPPTETSVPDTPLITEDRTLIFSTLHKIQRSPPDSDGEFDDSAEQILFDKLKHLPQDFYSLLRSLSLVLQKS